MKKSLGLLALSALLLTSCQSVMKTARTAEFPVSIKATTIVDLDVSEERVTYTMKPGRKVRRGGLENVIATAEREVLEQYDANVLVEPLHVVSKRRGLFGSKITSITVSGRPATYKNYRALKDLVGPEGEE
jgi:hypothetical protein